MNTTPPTSATVETAAAIFIRPVIVPPSMCRPPSRPRCRRPRGAASNDWLIRPGAIRGWESARPIGQTHLTQERHRGGGSVPRADYRTQELPTRPNPIGCKFPNLPPGGPRAPAPPASNKICGENGARVPYDTERSGRPCYTSEVLGDQHREACGKGQNQLRSDRNDYLKRQPGDDDWLLEGMRQAAPPQDPLRGLGKNKPGELQGPQRWRQEQEHVHPPKTEERNPEDAHVEPGRTTYGRSESNAHGEAPIPVAPGVHQERHFRRIRRNHNIREAVSDNDAKSR